MMTRTTGRAWWVVVCGLGLGLMACGADIGAEAYATSTEDEVALGSQAEALRVPQRAPRGRLADADKPQKVTRPCTWHDALGGHPGVQELALVGDNWVWQKCKPAIAVVEGGGTGATR